MIDVERSECRRPLAMARRATLLGTVLIAVVGAASPRAVAAGAAPLTCMGAGDLNVDGQHLALDGSLTFERVCVQHQGVLRVTGTLRAGLLSVDASSRIDDDGLPAGYYGDNPGDLNYCPQIGNGQNHGDPGGDLTIITQRATILGPISANGGAANSGTTTVDTGWGSCPGSDGHGGPGGHLTIEAADLTLAAPISAGGGPGGTGDGAGGVITVLLAQQPPPTLAALLQGPSASQSAKQGPGAAPGPGSAKIILGTLTSAQRASLPPLPPSPVQPLGPAPTRLPLQSVATFAAGMACGAGDLTVRAGSALRLSGVHRYQHVCVQGGGTLLAGRGLTLRASTIAIEPTGRISADGAIPAPPGLPPEGGEPPSTGYPADGRYQSAGARQTGPDAPHAGVPGATASIMEQQGPVTALGGAAGGAIALIAPRILLAGTVSADGRPGSGGTNQTCAVPDSSVDPTAGSGGGSGGGILVVADELQLSGSIAALGAPGGSGGTGTAEPATDGAPGSNGYIKIRVNTLRAPDGELPLAGPALIERALPTDPVPPSAASPGRYYPDTGHNLSGPFYTFYQSAPNPAVLFGRPLSEAFPLTGTATLVQFFDRAAMQETKGKITLIPLGRLLTRGHSFTPPTSVPAGGLRLANGFTLSGSFLTFWRNHAGAAFLGLPISQPFSGQNGDGSGRSYLMQWTSNARLEYHPELANTPYVVSLGLLGVETLRAQGLL